MRLTALLLAIAVSSSASDDPHAMQQLRNWTLAVDQHAAGERDEALERINGWSYDELELLRGYVEAIAEVPRNNRARETRRRGISNSDQSAIKELATLLRARGDFDEFRKRAAILHTDVAILGSPPAVVEAPQASPRRPRWAPGNEREVIVKSYDGRVEYYELKNLHWDYAMDLLDTLPALPRDPVIARWYRAIGAYLGRERRFADALRHFSRARSVAPDDPQVMFGEATLNETLGAPRIQNYVKVTTLPNGLYIRGVDSAQTHWRRAENLLRRAVTIDPTFAEARLRLGRIAIQLQRHEEGLQLVQRAATELTDPALKYFAHLFAGDALQSLDRPVEAWAAYEHALALFPDSQAARLGLGSAIRRTGDHQKALDAILPTLTKAPAERDGDDPWWDYYDGDTARVDALLAELRAPFRSPRR